MSEAKHTKGPWKKSERLNGPWWHISSAYSIGGSEAKSGRQAIACVHGESKRGATAYAEMFEANARLIAAAPELLEALKEVTMVLDRIFDVADRTPEPNSISGRARAVIAKAEGGAA